MTSGGERASTRAGVGRNVLVLGLSSMVSTFFLSLWQGYLPVYFAGFGYTKETIGLLFSLGAVATVAAFFVGGWMGDRLGRKFVIIMSTVLLAVSSALLSFGILFVIAIGLVVFYWATNALQPVFRAMITESVHPGYRGRALGIFNSLAVALAAVAVIVTGVLVGGNELAAFSGKLSELLVIGSVVILLVALARALLLSETHPASKVGPLGAFLKKGLLPLTMPKLRPLTVAYMVHDSALSLVLFLIPLYAVEYLGVTAEQLGAMLALNYIMNLLLQAPFGKLADDIGRTRVIAISFVVEAFALGSLVLARNALSLFVVYGAWVAVGQMDQPAEGALLADMSEEGSRATLMGGFGGLTTLAAIPAPAIGGILVGLFPGHLGGYAFPFYTAFALLLLSAVVVLVYRARVYSK